MTALAIRAEGLSKRYRIGARQQAYSTLGEMLSSCAANSARRLRQWTRGERRGSDEEIVWALKDVGFDVARGEVTAVIGRNGAGKSTLLKVLARISAPTEGSADVFGRVGSLIEVGTGFHGELTGRENVFLNGAILGMTKAEIRRKFDAIVAFAEVDRFIDTPVKRYSSGMHMRLAFAVAAHLEPEILLVDEVLAVGDAKFQQKCLGKMGDVAHEGRTVLFVSHNMSAVRALCTNGLFLDGGRLVHSGTVSECIERYYRAIGVLGTANLESQGMRLADRANSVFGRVSLEGKSGNTIHQSEPLRLNASLRIKTPVAGFSICCIIADSRGQWVLRADEDSQGMGLSSPLSGSLDLGVSFPPLWLAPGLYSLFFAVMFQGAYDRAFHHLSDTFPIDVTGPSPRRETVIHPPANWSARPGEATGLP